MISFTRYTFHGGGLEKRKLSIPYQCRAVVSYCYYSSNQANKFDGDHYFLFLFDINVQSNQLVIPQMRLVRGRRFALNLFGHGKAEVRGPYDKRLNDRIMETCGYETIISLGDAVAILRVFRAGLRNEKFEYTMQLGVAHNVIKKIDI